MGLWKAFIIGTIPDWFKIAMMKGMMKKRVTSDDDFVINTKDNDEKNDNANDDVIVLD